MDEDALPAKVTMLLPAIKFPLLTRSVFCRVNCVLPAIENCAPGAIVTCAEIVNADNTGRSTRNFDFIKTIFFSTLNTFLKAGNRTFLISFQEEHSVFQFFIFFFQFFYHLLLFLHCFYNWYYKISIAKSIHVILILWFVNTAEIICCIFCGLFYFLFYK